MSNENRRKSLLGLSAKKPEPNEPQEKQTAAATMAAELVSTSTSEEVNIVTNLHKDLADDLKLASRRSGKKLKVIINEQLAMFFKEPQPLENDYDTHTPYVKRSIMVRADVAQQLNDYTQKHDVTKRFVLEAVLSKYLQNI